MPRSEKPTSDEMPFGIELGSLSFVLNLSDGAKDGSLRFLGRAIHGGACGRGVAAAAQKSADL